MSMEREFTVEEANGMLPRLSRALVAIKEARRVILAGAQPFRGKAPTNGGGAQREEYWKAMAAMRAQLVWLIEEGIVLRDAESGLIDFPSRVDGQEVYLCWRLGEDRVGYWHGPESGFAGRRPL
jgi:hypothetical protein